MWLRFFPNVPKYSLFVTYLKDLLPPYSQVYNGGKESNKLAVSLNNIPCSLQDIVYLFIRNWTCNLFVLNNR